MDKEKIINFLQSNGLEEVEDLSYDDIIVLKFFFDFDDDELKAARAYASDECEEEEESDTWYDEFYLQYLNELAVDNVGEVIEDLMEELEIEAQYMSYELDKENHEYSEFVAVFYNKGKELDLDQILDKIEG